MWKVVQISEILFFQAFYFSEFLKALIDRQIKEEAFHLHTTQVLSRPWKEILLKYTFKLTIHCLQNANLVLVHMLVCGMKKFLP